MFMRGIWKTTNQRKHRMDNGQKTKNSTFVNTWKYIFFLYDTNKSIHSKPSKRDVWICAKAKCIWFAQNDKMTYPNVKTGTTHIKTYSKIINRFDIWGRFCFWKRQSRIFRYFHCWLLPEIRCFPNALRILADQLSLPLASWRLSGELCNIQSNFWAIFATILNYVNQFTLFKSWPLAQK